jgi:hypothetical protein
MSPIQRSELLDVTRTGTDSHHFPRDFKIITNVKLSSGCTQASTMDTILLDGHRLLCKNL